MLLIASGQTKSASKLLVWSRPPPFWKKLIFEPTFLFGSPPLAWLPQPWEVLGVIAGSGLRTLHDCLQEAAREGGGSRGFEEVQLEFTPEIRESVVL